MYNLATNLFIDNYSNTNKPAIPVRITSAENYKSSLRF